MSIEKLPSGRWRVRYYVGGRSSLRKSRTFARERDAKLFQAEVDRRKALGELASFEAANQTVKQLATDWWERYAEPNLAWNTLVNYQRVLDAHVIPRLGRLRLRDVKPGVVADFRARLERAGVGRDAVRKSMVVLQAMFKYAEQSEEWGVTRNPVRPVKKPSSRRERTVVCLAPAQVEAIRGALIARGKIGDATVVSVIAYAGLRFPEEVLALEWRHVRDQTLLVEQRNLDGEIVPALKSSHHRPVDLLGALGKDLAAWQLRCGRPTGRTLVFPRPDESPWRRHDVGNWRRRVWHKARKDAGIDSLPPYDLRHAFASLQIRAGMSIPELAEQMGHSPQMTVTTYTHVIRELKGQPVVSAEHRIARAREARRPLVAHGRDPADA